MPDSLDVGQPAHAVSNVSTDDGHRYSPESYQKALNNTPLSVFAQAAAAYASAPPLGNLRTPDILDCVLCDHANVLTLFNRFFQAAEARSIDTMTMVLNALAIDLRLHSQAEEQVLYPTLVQRLGSEGSILNQRALAEHAVVEQSVAELLQLHCVDSSCGENLLQRMKQCQTEFMTHQGEEEAVVLPKLAAVCSSEELCSLGLAFKSAKQAVTIVHPSSRTTLRHWMETCRD